MKFTDLTIKQVLSIACPTCGAAIGQGCVRNSGGELRVEPHNGGLVLVAKPEM